MRKTRRLGPEVLASRHMTVDDVGVAAEAAPVREPTWTVARSVSPVSCPSCIGGLIAGISGGDQSADGSARGC
ncbi:hypothetical protein I546_3701 [Mycobacterium kansasii 732]|nr:hypothetical protein I546_3701 [Mycobacterium kansasii 732]